MSRKLFSVLLALVFVGAFAGTSMAGAWSGCANGPSEGLSCTSHDRSISSMNTDLNALPGSYMMNSAQVQGPVETGALPGHDLSTFESQHYSVNHVRNFDPSNTYPARLWGANPWPTPNIQDGP